jgi:hypothetical protein
MKIYETDNNNNFIKEHEIENFDPTIKSVPFKPPENVPEGYVAHWNGRWTVVKGAAEIIDRVYLHISMAGGDGMIPVGIVNNSTDTIQFTATLRASKDPASEVVPYSKEWRIVVRDTEGKAYDVLKVAMAEGVINLAYNTMNPPAVCNIDPSDMTDLVELEGIQYALEILGDAEFKVYRDFT